MTVSGSIAEATISATTGMPRIADGSVNLQEALRQLAESVVNEATGSSEHSSIELAPFVVN